MAVYITPLPPKRENAHSLYECSYGCKHVWISDKGNKVSCPNCPIVNVQELWHDVHPDLKIERMQTSTFSQTRFYNFVGMRFEDYKKDSLLTELELNGFKSFRPHSEQVVMKNDLNEIVIFNFAKNRKTSTFYIGLHNENDSLFSKLRQCIKTDKINAKNNPVKIKKPEIQSMKDSRGQDVAVGDWVCAWGTRNLSFGKIVAIEKFKECSWHTEKQMLIGAKIKKGKVILPHKTSEQIFLLTPEQSLVLALEQ